MIGIALNIWHHSSHLVKGAHLTDGPAQLSVEFQDIKTGDIKTIKIGSPVIAEGELIGNVSAIAPIATDTLPSTGTTSGATSGLNEKLGGYAVQLKIAPRHRVLLRKGTIALIKTPFSTTRRSPETVLELFIPHDMNSPALSEGATLVGYSSFEEFWSADFSARGIANDAFQLSSTDV